MICSRGGINSERTTGSNATRTWALPLLADPVRPSIEKTVLGRGSTLGRSAILDATSAPRDQRKSPLLVPSQQVCDWEKFEAGALFGTGSCPLAVDVLITLSPMRKWAGLGLFRLLGSESGTSMVLRRMAHPGCGLAGSSRSGICRKGSSCTECFRRVAPGQDEEEEGGEIVESICISARAVSGSSVVQYVTAEIMRSVEMRNLAQKRFGFGDSGCGLLPQ